MSTVTNWYAWHDGYDELTSEFGIRLGQVQDLVRTFLDQAPAGDIRLVSIAAGQSRELIPMLIAHPRGTDVHARLVELDARNADLAEGALISAQLSGVEVVVADAGSVDSFVGAIPAQLILACGLFDLVGEAGAAQVVSGLSQLCAQTATVIWADELPGDLIAGLLTEAGFEVQPGDGAGSARLATAPAPFVPGTRMFGEPAG